MKIFRDFNLAFEFRSLKKFCENLIITYCLPAIYPLLTKKQIESLENVQKLCTKMILPSSEYYHERLNVLSLPPLVLLSENLYRTHFVKIMSDKHHRLHSFIPERSLPAAVILRDRRTVF